MQSEHRHPFTSLALLIAVALSGFFVFSALAVIAGCFIYGPAILSDLGNGTANMGMQKLFIALSSAGMFVFPALAFARIESNKPLSYLNIKKPLSWWMPVLVILIMLSITPFIEWTVFANQQMKLPAFLEGIEKWMKDKELQAEVLTKQLLVMNSFGSLLLNLFIIAVIPAIGEEFFFRGCLQKIFTRWSANKHLGIWISAILFSAIHVQFYGFIPRMLLGASFGYMLLLSKSIWVPVLAHFYNNASAVIAAYVLQQHRQSLDNLTKPEFESWYLVILSVIFTALLFIVFKKLAINTQQYANSYERRLD